MARGVPTPRRLPRSRGSPRARELPAPPAARGPAWAQRPAPVLGPAGAQRLPAVPGRVPPAPRCRSGRSFPPLATVWHATARGAMKLIAYRSAFASPRIAWRPPRQVPYRPGPWTPRRRSRSWLRTHWTRTSSGGSCRPRRSPGLAAAVASRHTAAAGRCGGSPGIAGCSVGRGGTVPPTRPRHRWCRTGHPIGPAVGCPRYGFPLVGKARATQGGQ